MNCHSHPRSWLIEQPPPQILLLAVEPEGQRAVKDLALKINTSIWKCQTSLILKSKTKTNKKPKTGHMASHNHNIILLCAWQGRELEIYLLNSTNDYYIIFQCRNTMVIIEYSAPNLVWSYRLHVTQTIIFFLKPKDFCIAPKSFRYRIRNEHLLSSRELKKDKTWPLFSQGSQSHQEDRHAATNLQCNAEFIT